MSENEQPEVSLETKIELESQADASQEHALTQEKQAAEIMAPETPVTITDSGSVVPEPVPVTQLPPSRSTYETPGNPLRCLECGFMAKNDNALKAHVRFKHELPRARKLAADRKAARTVNGEALAEPPPPDFSDIPGAPPIVQPAPVPKFESMANMTFDMTTGLMARIFGPEWLPQPDPDNKDVSTERKTVVLAIQKYYESVNLPDIPPGYMLCFVVLAYSAPRLAAQPTKTKLQSGWLKLKSFFQRKRGLPAVPRPPQAINHEPAN